ncbi:MAG TPA: hypothetical protein VH308_13125 [Terracidiphilus sp.]|jgi:hypothetical protein|nr:hypothetical protein [Terracidiphilus sp.]
MSFAPRRNLFVAAVFIAVAAAAPPEDAAPDSTATLSSVQIVEQMMAHEQAHNRHLKHYQALRHYQAQYRGFPTNLEARMDVEVSFDSASGKRLQIVSQSGSKFLLEKVLKRAVDSETESSQQKASPTLTPANYRFQLLGSEVLGGRPAFILDVQPIMAGKFLVRGKIWVDAADFAIAKMETQPAKSPSFWLSRPLIHYTGAKTDGFWMPQKLVSETGVRIGGRAVLTIDYGNYQIATNSIH